MNYNIWNVQSWFNRFESCVTLNEFEWIKQSAPPICHTCMTLNVRTAGLIKRNHAGTLLLKFFLLEHHLLEQQLNKCLYKITPLEEMQKNLFCQFQKSVVSETADGYGRKPGYGRKFQGKVTRPSRVKRKQEMRHMTSNEKVLSFGIHNVYSYYPSYSKYL